MAAVGTLQSARDDCSTGESEGDEREGKERKCGMQFCPFPARVRLFVAPPAHAALPHAPARDTTRQYIDASTCREWRANILLANDVTRMWYKSMDDLWWRRPRLPSSASTGTGRTLRGLAGSEWAFPPTTRECDRNSGVRILDLLDVLTLRGPMEPSLLDAVPIPSLPVFATAHAVRDVFFSL
ncbi:hypothetical protein C8R44DRAFT_872589 [Mycena epipterygia]|nr:hypothetical protein C8R44DRAFT_872589 [Mycena epipterygia]